MRLHLPTYLGGDEVELDTDGISPDEKVIGWVDGYGAIISSRANVRIGDLISCKNSEFSALVMVRSKS